MRAALDDILLKAIDDQLFYLMEGYRTPAKALQAGGEPPPLALLSDHLTSEEVGHYRYLAELQVDANIALELLANAFSVSQASQIEPLRERFEATKGRIDRNLAALEESPLPRSGIPPVRQTV